MSMGTGNELDTINKQLKQSYIELRHINHQIPPHLKRTPCLYRTSTSPHLPRL
jgi:hypothetical protein